MNSVIRFFIYGIALGAGGLMIGFSAPISNNSQWLLGIGLSAFAWAIVAMASDYERP